MNGSVVTFIKQNIKIKVPWDRSIVFYCTKIPN